MELLAHQLCEMRGKGLPGPKIVITGCMDEQEKMLLEEFGSFGSDGTPAAAEIDRIRRDGVQVS